MSDFNECQVVNTKVHANKSSKAFPHPHRTKYLICHRFINEAWTLIAQLRRVSTIAPAPIDIFFLIRQTSGEKTNADGVEWIDGDL